MLKTVVDVVVFIVVNRFGYMQLVHMHDTWVKGTITAAKHNKFKKYHLTGGRPIGFYDNSTNSRAPIGSLFSSISEQTHEFRIYAMRQRARADIRQFVIVNYKWTSVLL